MTGFLNDRYAVLSCLVRIDRVLCTEITECHLRELINWDWLLDLLRDNLVRLLKGFVELSAVVVVNVVREF